MPPPAQTPQKFAEKGQKTTPNPKPGSKANSPKLSPAALRRQAALAKKLRQAKESAPEIPLMVKTYKSTKTVVDEYNKTTQAADSQLKCITKDTSWEWAQGKEEEKLQEALKVFQGLELPHALLLIVSKSKNAQTMLKQYPKGQKETEIVTELSRLEALLKKPVASLKKVCDRLDRMHYAQHKDQDEALAGDGPKKVTKKRGAGTTE
jgi:hypothetical protein